MRRKLFFLFVPLLLSLIFLPLSFGFPEGQPFKELSERIDALENQVAGFFDNFVSRNEPTWEPQTSYYIVSPSEIHYKVGTMTSVDIIVHLPHGANVTKFTATLWDNRVSWNGIYFYWVSATLLVGNRKMATVFTTTEMQDGWYTLETSEIERSIVDNSLGQPYHIKIRFSPWKGANVNFGNAIIEYTTIRP